MPSTPVPDRSPRVALATSAAAWSLDEDAPLTAALTDVGLDACGGLGRPRRRLVRLELVVIRSTGDFTRPAPRVVEWIERVRPSPTCATPPR